MAVNACNQQLELAIKNLTIDELNGVLDALALVADHYEEMKEPEEGLYLVPPYGGLIASGDMKCFAKPRYDERLFGRKVLVSGHSAYGVMDVGEPIQISVGEFDDLFNKRHRVSMKDRLRWWPDKKSLYLYPIDKFENYDKPKETIVFPGVQMYMKNVVFQSDKGGPGSGHHGHGGRPGQVGGSALSGVSFGSFEDADQWGRDHWAKVYEKLSPNEKSIIQSYAGNAYEEVNDYLRTGDDPDAFWVDATLRAHGDGDVNDWFAGRVSTEDVVSEFTKPLDDALERGVVPNNVVVYRGIDSGTGASFREGQVFKDSAYVSSSLLEKQALGFSEKGGYVMRIKVSKGSHGLYMGGLVNGEVAREAELLLPRNSKFRITSIRKAGDVYIVDTELL